MPSETLNIKVAGRVRPLTEAENAKGAKRVVKVNGSSVSIDASNKEQSFTCDFAFGSEVKMGNVYNNCTEHFLLKALNGYNIAVLAYGAAGSGKSFLMNGYENEPGIVPCLIKSLFHHIEAAAGKKQFFITASFVEIVEDHMTDMLNPHSNEMRIREHPQLGIYVDGLSEIVARTEDDLESLFEQGNRARKMGTSEVRSHKAKSSGIFTINIEQKENSTAKVGIRSRIQMADLAGIETSGDKSVNAMCNVLQAIKKGGHVPYRESKVTRILQDAVGGDCATLMFATLSPADKSYSETVHTLQNAMIAKGIKNKVKMNLDETTSVISELREEIARLRTKITKNPDDKDSVLKMEDMIKDLQVAKTQTWEEKERLSLKYEDERKTNLANKGILEWVMDTAKRGNKEQQERIVILQKEKDQLTLEYRDKRKMVDDIKDDLQKKINEYSKIAESKKGGNETDTKSKVTAIHDLKERLKKETENLKDIKRRLKDLQDRQRSEKEAAQGQAVVKGNAEVRQMVELEERKKLEHENKALLAEELERQKLEIEHQKAEIQMRLNQGKKYTNEEASKLDLELVDLRADMSVVTLQIQCLQHEKEKLKKDLEETYRRQNEELEIQQLQHFQTFRQYREMFEQQKAVLEQRYRGLLEDAIQDAIFLSSRNSELLQENQALQQDKNEMKDKVTLLEGRVGRK